MRILILGNSPHIHNLPLYRLDPNVKTIGLNRIYNAFWPDIWYFSDLPSVLDLEDPDDVPASTRIIYHANRTHEHCLDVWPPEKQSRFSRHLRRATVLKRRDLPIFDGMLARESLICAIFHAAAWFGHPAQLDIYLAGVDLTIGRSAHFCAAATPLSDASILRQQRRLKVLMDMGINIVNTNIQSDFLNSIMPFLPFETLLT